MSCHAICHILNSVIEDQRFGYEDGLIYCTLLYSDDTSAGPGIFTSANTVVCFMNDRILAMVGMYVSRGTQNIAVAEELVIAECRMNVLAICRWHSVLLL
jgi:hypothetical protein